MLTMTLSSSSILILYITLYYKDSNETSIGTQPSLADELSDKISDESNVIESKAESESDKALVDTHTHDLVIDIDVPDEDVQRTRKTSIQAESRDKHSTFAEFVDKMDSTSISTSVGTNVCTNVTNSANKIGRAHV